MATMPTMPTGRQSDGGTTTGHEVGLWALADTLRGSMDASEYKHVVLGPIGFCKSAALDDVRRHDHV